MNRTALLIVDMQVDFLTRPALLPPQSVLIAQSTLLATGCRGLGVPVLHSQTRVDREGMARMPHWKERDIMACVEGSPGALPPVSLQPLENEPVFTKRFYSAFESSELERHLEKLQVERLLVAGVYLHACIRSSVLDAYARGFQVCIIDDAVGSTEPVHAELTRDYLRQRAIEFTSCDEALRRLAGEAGGSDGDFGKGQKPGRVACIGGEWQEAPGHRRRMRHRQPARSNQVIAEVPVAESTEVEDAARTAQQAYRACRSDGREERLGQLQGWSDELAQRAGVLVDAIVHEIGKPRAEALAEVHRAQAHIDTAVRVARTHGGTIELGNQITARHQPRGVIGLITPWNNPAAIPVGKIAPALAFGNSLVWKPAHQAPETARLLIESLGAAGIPEAMVNLVFGDGDTAREIMASPMVQAISITGSTSTGATAAALCARHAKPLQAELGGNNAAIVLADADIAAAVSGLALAAFGFAGQRCTATRRLVVERAAIDEFLASFLPAMAKLRVGDPEELSTQVGPLISAEHRSRVEAAISFALEEGGQLLSGGGRPASGNDGFYLNPTLITGLEPTASLILHETFGPVAILQPAEDFDDALALLNGVSQGLVASIHTSSPEKRRRFIAAAEAGILKLAPGALAIHPDAPFGGWKSSGMGPPEHGQWDHEFYTRPQAIYADQGTQP